MVQSKKGYTGINPGGCEKEMVKTKQEYEALKAEYIALLEWCTTGDHSGNPYGHDEIKRAIMYLELKKECPAKWCGIYNLKKPLPIIEVG